MLAYPYAERLYPGALDALASLRAAGPAVVLSDGDAVFQPWKVSRAGIRDAADAVLVYVHKEESSPTSSAGIRRDTTSSWTTSSES